MNIENSNCSDTYKDFKEMEYVYTCCVIWRKNVEIGFWCSLLDQKEQVGVRLSIMVIIRISCKAFLILPTIAHIISCYLPACEAQCFRFLTIGIIRVH